MVRSSVHNVARLLDLFYQQSNPKRFDLACVIHYFLQGVTELKSRSAIFNTFQVRHWFPHLDMNLIYHLVCDTRTLLEPILKVSSPFATHSDLLSPPPHNVVDQNVYRLWRALSGKLKVVLPDDTGQGNH